MKKTHILTMILFVAFAGIAQAQNYTIDFEGLATGTNVTGDYAISPLLSIYNDGENYMRVVKEGTGVRAYSATGKPINYLPEENAKCFGNDADGSPTDDDDDLLITFNPDIVVTCFSIDLADFGDYCDVYPYNYLKASLTAYSYEDTAIQTDTLEMETSHFYDAANIGLQKLSVQGEDIAYVKLIFDPLDRGTGFDNIEICYKIRVDIDIKPGSFPNSFNINGKGVIPVAILGSADFEVTCIDPESLLLGGLEVSVKGKDKLMVAFEDVNGDGFEDLVVKFEDDASLWEPGDGIAELTGSLKDECGGYPILGVDSINVVQEVN